MVTPPNTMQIKEDNCEVYYPRQWEKNNIGNIKIQLAIIKEVIWQVDQAQERSLCQSEIAFRDRLKEMYLGLLALERE
jgi:hypothetical protein